MIDRIKRILRIAGRKKSALIAAVVFDVLKALCIGGSYVVQLEIGRASCRERV